MQFIDSRVASVAEELPNPNQQQILTKNFFLPFTKSAFTCFQDCTLYCQYLKKTFISFLVLPAIFSFWFYPLTFSGYRFFFLQNRGKELRLARGTRDIGGVGIANFARLHSWTWQSITCLQGGMPSGRCSCLKTPPYALMDQPSMKSKVDKVL